jgi:hypothetical protein
MIWIIIISLFVAFLLWLLLAPVVIWLNTDTNHYQIALPGIFKAVVVPNAELFHIRGWVFFIPYKFDPFRMKKKKKKKKSDKPVIKKRRPKKLSGNIQMVIDAVRSFRIRKLYLDIDTDDFVLNAWLVPVFSSVNSDNIRMRVNFEGTSSLLLDLRVKLGVLLWILIRNKCKSFFNL